MNIQAHVRRLEENAHVIQTLLKVNTEQARWRPDRDRWSLLEVINHLCDEEREDFRVRLDTALKHPDRPYPAIDPMDWVLSRDYNGREPAGSLQVFLEERQSSIRWLGGLDAVDWNARPSVEKGPCAGDLMVSWVAHDFFHIRQISTLHWDYLAATSTPYGTAYAGELT